MGTSEPPNPFRGARFANHTFDTRRTRRARPLGFRHAPGFMSQLFWDAFVGDWLQTLTACVAHHDNSERLEAHKHREQPRSSAREKCTPRSDKPSESVHLPPPSGPADEILAAVSAALSRLPSPAKESTQAGPGHTEKARALLQVSKRTKLCEMTYHRAVKELKLEEAALNSDPKSVERLKRTTEILKRRLCNSTARDAAATHCAEAASVDGRSAHHFLRSFTKERPTAGRVRSFPGATSDAGATFGRTQSDAAGATVGRTQSDAAVDLTTCSSDDWVADWVRRTSPIKPGNP